MLKKRAEKEVTPTTTESRCSRARSAGPPTLESNRIWERTQDKAKPHKSRDSFSNEGVTQDKARRHKRKKMVDEGRTTTHPTERQPQTRTTSNVCPHLRWCRRAMVRFPLTLKKTNRRMEPSFFPSIPDTNGHGFRLLAVGMISSATTATTTGTMIL